MLSSSKPSLEPGISLVYTKL